MNLLNHFNRVPDLLIIDEADLLDCHPFAREEEEQDDHEGQYYCGICGRHIPQEEYLTHRH